MVPGAFNAISARLVEQTGFEVAYVSGATTSNGLAGLPDIELLSSSEIISTAGYIARSVSIPVIADADTGYGGPLAVARTTAEFERAGLSAIHLEDQASPKRCGHLADKRIVEVEEMQAKIRAATESRAKDDFLIIARTDSAGVEGFDSAVERGRAYREAGADIVFPEALTSVEDFASYAQSVDAPLLANMTEFGKTPMLTREEFEQLGYALVIYPVTAFRAALQAVQRVYEHLHAEETQASMIDAMMTREELYRVLDYARYQDMERHFYGEETGSEARPWRDLGIGEASDSTRG
jgi:methylisocitrate lyase